MPHPHFSSNASLQDGRVHVVARPPAGRPDNASGALHLRRAIHLLWWISALGCMLTGASLSLF